LIVTLKQRNGFYSAPNSSTETLERFHYSLTSSSNILLQDEPFGSQYENPHLCD